MLYWVFILFYSILFYSILFYSIVGKRFKEVTDAVKDLTKESDSPAVATNLGGYLKRIAGIKISNGIENHNERDQEEGRDFLLLMETHWYNRYCATYPQYSLTFLPPT